jgi:hypothetical protein
MLSSGNPGSKLTPFEGVRKEKKRTRAFSGDLADMG